MEEVSSFPPKDQPPGEVWLDERTGRIMTPKPSRPTSSPASSSDQLVVQAFESAPIPMFVLDGEWLVSRLNEAVLDGFGYLRSELVGQPPPFVKVTAPAPQPNQDPVIASDVERLRTALAKLAGRVLEDETIVRQANGVLSGVILRVSLIFDRVSRETVGAVVVICPPSPRSKSDRAGRRSSGWWKS
jgi:PAS domain S-box-containing protein